MHVSRFSDTLSFFLPVSFHIIRIIIHINELQKKKVTHDSIIRDTISRTYIIHEWTFNSVTGRKFNFLDNRVISLEMWRITSNVYLFYQFDSVESRRKKEGEFYKLWWSETMVEKMVVGNFVIDLRWEGKLGNRFTLKTSLLY